jgi:twitching motility protein PilT
MDKEIFHKLLTAALQKGASDIHLQAGAQPLFRMNGELFELKYRILSPEDTQNIVQEILSQSAFPHDITAISELDISYGLEGQGRFRANIFRQRGAFGIVLRVIPITIRSFAELNLPAVLSKIANLRRGLVLVVGATGNGKSTTLASLLEYINSKRRAHVVTIEDPIEFLFKN